MKGKANQDGGFLDLLPLDWELEEVAVDVD
jgi:hypothetical protein